MALGGTPHGWHALTRETLLQIMPRAATYLLLLRLMGHAGCSQKAEVCSLVLLQAAQIIAEQQPLAEREVKLARRRGQSLTPSPSLQCPVNRQVCINGLNKARITGEVDSRVPRGHRSIALDEGRALTSLSTVLQSPLFSWARAGKLLR